VDTTNFINAFKTQLQYRVITTKIANAHKYSYDLVETEKELKFHFNNGTQKAAFIIPKPFMQDGVELIELNAVKRPTCKYYIRHQDKLITFIECINELFFGDINTVIPREVYSAKSNVMETLKFGYTENKLDYAIYVIQKALNFIILQLPLHTTNMNSWAMNHRIQIIDPDFMDITDPAKKHQYQVDKNKLFFDRGWTSLGLSDGSLADKNYILDVDLRRLTPYGLKHHNPQRNLYSTLGMKGDELPIVRSASMQNLMDKGVTRKGWNLFTLFVDIPDVWEDQIMVDISHKDKFITNTKTFISKDNPVVFKGAQLYTEDILFVSKDGKKQLFNIKCDEAKVVDIKVNLDVEHGVEREVTKIVVEYKRYLKEGTKITNNSANKGVIRMQELGYAIHPITGEKVKIDVIVSAKAVLKRKNYAQILEALTNNVYNNKTVVLPDDIETSEERIKRALKAGGFPKDGVWECDTYAGKLKGICGKVFWGVTHDANDTVWYKKEILNTNGRGLRTAGLKFSTIEFRALRTRFGMNNPIEKEILSHAAGQKDFNEMVAILKHKLGKSIYTAKTISVADIETASATNGILFSKEELIGTILDKGLGKEGFLLKLPVTYQTIIGEDNTILAEGFPSDNINTLNDVPVKKTIKLDTIYVPWYNLRKPWKQGSNEYGISSIAASLNTIIIHSKKLINGEDDAKTLSLLYKSIYNYYAKIKLRMGSKRGEISLLGMSVRYPHSAKAVASLSNTLPKDTIEIHSSMAKDVGINHGDIVLVERFPCLGFMSIRPQQVFVTEEEDCRYTIRASSNSLGSLTLDFDGDVLYIAAMKTEEARRALRKEWENPNPVCKSYIEKFNAKMGIPRTKELALENYNITTFDTLNADTHAAIVSKLTGVKSYTGPVVALAYNILRIMETSIDASNIELWAGIEVFMDTVANSVFKQKHGKKSLHAVVTEAVCTADEKLLVKEGFDPEISRIVCDTIKAKAIKRNIKDLVAYHKRSMENGRSSFINRVVREENKLYFASRATLNEVALTSCLEACEIVDVPSSIYAKIMKQHVNIAGGKFYVK